MISSFLLYLISILSLGLAYQVNEKEPLPPKLPLQPGDLLRSLDKLTSDAQVIYSPLQRTDNQSADRRVFNNDNDDAASEYDYDKAYENFVNKYFTNGEKDLDSENIDGDDVDEDEKAEEIDDAAPFSSSDEEDDKHAASEKSSKTKKCERVKIDGQSCVVCEDPESNEKSKTCSYSSESKPKSYGYSKQRSTKNSSDGEDGDDDDSVENKKSSKRETGPNKGKYPPRRTSIKALLKPVDENSKCTRKLENGLVCFYCESPLENTRECVTDKNNPKKRLSDESSKKDSTKKKIFKRMVTYSFKNDAQPQIKANTFASLRGY